ncbi:hypothetical protein MPL1_02773 [Methylophaga lonarensis MPL]|uniref:DUF2007 domain-containing protein n=1 Tax=Methylophaga lonarensis MPL TaxID=1286106 RepID=M7NYD4_9GAMM|nr:DUF2007 domain-containing protein [Methylophaga lonarensis]EMR13818.1 hypothetical protein MPL1_02773 [Methylophaga lonarensis MPL]
MKLIFEASDISEAHIVAGMLENAGLQTQVNGFFLQGAVGELPASDFVKVYLLDEADFEQAQQLIAEYLNNKVEHDCAIQSSSSMMTKAAMTLGLLLAVLLLALLL